MTFVKYTSADVPYDCCALSLYPACLGVMLIYLFFSQWIIIYLSLKIGPTTAEALSIIRGSVILLDRASSNRKLRNFSCKNVGHQFYVNEIRRY